MCQVMYNNTAAASAHNVQVSEHKHALGSVEAENKPESVCNIAYPYQIHNKITMYRGGASDYTAECNSRLQEVQRHQNC